jgi:hypothetical protein
MKTMKADNLIIRKLYTFTTIKNNEITGQDKCIVSYTRMSAYIVNNTNEEDISRVIEIIAKQQKLDVMQYDQFEFAFDKVKQAVSWN